jgi:hypothetical protein
MNNGNILIFKGFVQTVSKVCFSTLQLERTYFWQDSQMDDRLYSNWACAVLNSIAGSPHILQMRFSFAVLNLDFTFSSERTSIYSNI